jgi:hypothetical protein
MSNTRRARPQAAEVAPQPSRIRCLGHEGITRPENPHPDVTGQWLKSYDPEAHDGQGWAEWTDDPAQARVFPSRMAAFEAWRAVPRARPLRADGRMNRPLTAFTVTIEGVPGA